MRATLRSRMFIIIPLASMSSVLVVFLLGVWFSSSLWTDNGGSCWCDVMREYAVSTFVAFAFCMKDARTIVVELACFAFVALTLQVMFA